MSAEIYIAALVTCRVAIQNEGTVPLRIRSSVNNPDGSATEAPLLPPGSWCSIGLTPNAGLIIEPAPEGEPA